MAEVVGFELTNGLTRCRFSRPVPSTTRPHLQLRYDIIVKSFFSATLFVKNMHQHALQNNLSEKYSLLLYYSMLMIIHRIS